MFRKVFMEQTLHIKSLKTKNKKLILLLNRPEKAIQLQASIVFQNTGVHFSHPVELSTDNSSEMVLKIDASFLEQNDGDWTLVFQDTTSDTVYTAILDSKVRLALLLGGTMSVGVISCISRWAAPVTVSCSDAVTGSHMTDSVSE